MHFIFCWENLCEGGGGGNFEDRELDSLIFRLYNDTISITYVIPGYIQNFPDWVDNEINKNKHSLRNSTKSHVCKTH